VLPLSTLLPSGGKDAAIIVDEGKLQAASLTKFKEALAGHRSFAQEADVSVV
jgi:hypothetical protein